MRINEEQVMKLNQLDRIEFRQRYKQLEDNTKEAGAFDFFWEMMALVGFLILIATIFISTGNISAGKSITNIIPNLIKIVLLFFILMCLVDVLYSLDFIKKRNKLLKEYFDIEIKVWKK